MKASKFAEAQIALVLKQVEDGWRSARCAGRPGSRRQRSTTGASVVCHEHTDR
jgi:hypothetical protein